MNPKGKMKYVPPNVFEELNCIKNEDELDRDADAFNKMVEHSRCGREVEKIRRGLFPGIDFFERRRNKG